jgi:putative peptide zinc metalloprotease protein
MSASLFSPVWYRVADQHPHLRAEVRVQRQRVRGERWYLLVNTAEGRQFRVNAKGYEFIGRCDGERTVEVVWNALVEQLRDDAPTQDEVVQLLNELDAQGLIAHENAPEAKAMVRRRDQRKKGVLQGFVNPFALRVPVGDPSPWLERLHRVPGLVFNPVAFWLWLLAAVAAALAAASHWPQLTSHASEYMSTPRYLALAWVVFPLLKALHEVGHALAVRRWGGEVHDAGFSLFVLVPAPYVDATAAAAFTERRKRLVVGAAGMMVELAVAAVALIVWLNVQPGFARDLAFVTMFIASVSTVVFNGNPLLRFDGYYILCDAFDLPNLDSRSKAWWSQAASRSLGGATASPLQVATGELKWLVAYAPLSIAYRVLIAWLLVVWLGAHSTLLAFIAAIVLGSLLMKPAASALARKFDTAGTPRWRASAITATAGIGLLAGLCAVPLPFHTVVAGVVWPTEQARVRPATDGFVSELIARDGERVAAGDVLVVLEDAALLAEREKLASRLDQLQASRFSALIDSTERARNIDEEIAGVQAALARAEQRIGHLEVRAQAAGTLVMPHQQDLPGTFVRQGSTLAHIVEPSQVGIRAVVPEYDAALVRNMTRAIDVRVAGDRDTVAAQVVRDAPSATFELPSAALGDRGGGALPTDPADKDGLRARDPVVLVDLAVPARKLERIGATAWVRFDHGAQPLAERWLRQVRQAFLQHFNPAS